MTKTIIQTLQHIKGDYLERCANQEADLIRAIRELRKGGSLTLKIKYDLLDKNENAISVTATVDTKLPKPEPRKTIFFSTDDGDLLRNDPDQEELDLKPVPVNQQPTNTPKKIGE